MSISQMNTFFRRTCGGKISHQIEQKERKFIFEFLIDSSQRAGHFHISTSICFSLQLSKIDDGGSSFTKEQRKVPNV